MVLISLHPFAFKKIVLLAVTILGLSSVVCFGDSLFMATRYSPAAQRRKTGVGDSSPITARSQAPSAAVEYRAIEKCQPEPTSFAGMGTWIITPIVNHSGSYAGLRPGPNSKYRSACLTDVEETIQRAN